MPWLVLSITFICFLFTHIEDCSDDAFYKIPFNFILFYFCFALSFLFQFPVLHYLCDVVALVASPHLVLLRYVPFFFGNRRWAKGRKKSWDQFVKESPLLSSFLALSLISATTQLFKSRCTFYLRL